MTICRNTNNSGIFICEVTMNINLTKVADIIKTVAHNEIIPKYRNLKKEEIECKTSNTDLVTIVDGNSERELSSMLKKYIPAAAVLGEEGVFANPTDANLVDNDGYVWIIDPLDGTKNFIENSEYFGIIVALLKNHETIAGWIYTPILGNMTMAEKGGGVYADNKKITINQNRDIITDFDMVYDFDHVNLPDFVRSLNFLWCSAVEYQWLLTGKADAGFFCGYLKPWDHTAGLFLHREAGGYNAFWSGEPYNNRANPKQNNPLLLAPNIDVWKELKDIIKYNPSNPYIFPVS